MARSVYISGVVGPAPLRPDVRRLTRIATMALMTCPKCGKQFYGVGCPDCDYPARLPDASEARRRQLFGIALLAASVFVAIRFFIESLPFSTRLLLLVVTAIFGLAGVQLVTGVKGRASAFMGGLVCLGLSVLGFVAAFSGRVSGGIPFIPDAWNQTGGKLAFGLGACITAAMSFYFLRQALKPSIKK